MKWREFMARHQALGQYLGATVMRLIGTVVLVLVIANTSASKAADCGSPTDLHDGWTVTAPANEGLDSALICGIGRFELLSTFPVDPTRPIPLHHPQVLTMSSGLAWNETNVAQSRLFAAQFGL
jgi:hypothetical protein